MLFLPAPRASLPRRFLPASVAVWLAVLWFAGGAARANTTVIPVFDVAGCTAPAIPTAIYPFSGFGLDLDMLVSFVRDGEGPERADHYVLRRRRGPGGREFALVIDALAPRIGATLELAIVARDGRTWDATLELPAFESGSDLERRAIGIALTPQEQRTAFPRPGLYTVVAASLAEKLDPEVEACRGSASTTLLVDR